MYKRLKPILENRDDRLTNILIGLGVANAIFFMFISGRFISAIRGFLQVFGD